MLIGALGEARIGAGSQESDILSRFADSDAVRRSLMAFPLMASLDARPTLIGHPMQIGLLSLARFTQLQRSVSCCCHVVSFFFSLSFTFHRSRRRCERERGREIDDREKEEKREREVGMAGSLSHTYEERSFRIRKFDSSETVFRNFSRSTAHRKN